MGRDQETDAGRGAANPLTPRAESKPHGPNKSSRDVADHLDGRDRAPEAEATSDDLEGPTPSDEAVERGSAPPD
jgi:hypothetical protein